MRTLTLFTLLQGAVFAFACGVLPSVAWAQEQPGGGSEIKFDVEGPDFQRTPPDAAEAAAALGVMVAAAAVGLVVGLAISVVIILLITSVLNVVPQQYREIEPAMVWLLLIPLFNLIWNFFVFPKVSRSLQKYFAAQGKSEHGDCGEKIGFWYAICGTCCIIPCVNYLAGPAGLVLLIIYLVKIHGLKKFVTG